MTAQPFGCVGNTIKLRSGLYLDLSDPQPDQFTFGDIATGLSKLCRFGGHCRYFYSVAEHCVNCDAVAHADGHDAAVRLAVLMHDAAEAFIGDVVKPLKIMLGGYRSIEERLERVIAAKFGIDFELHAEIIREIDQAMVIAERRRLFDPDDRLWPGEAEVRALSIVCYCHHPDEAENQFRRRAATLGIKDALPT